MKNRWLIVLFLVSNLLFLRFTCKTYLEPLPECNNSFTDPRDNETYCIEFIGNQIWMAENLRFDTIGSWVNPDNPTNYPPMRFGRMYDWATALTVCPNGWRLPTDKDWNILELSLGMSQSETSTVSATRGTHGTELKSKNSWNSASGYLNTPGFNALAAGVYSSGNFDSLGSAAYFWTSTEFSPTTSWFRSLSFSHPSVERNYSDKMEGYQCRCIKE